MINTTIRRAISAGLLTTAIITAPVLTPAGAVQAESWAEIARQDTEDYRRWMMMDPNSPMNAHRRPPAQEHRPSASSSGGLFGWVLGAVAAGILVCATTDACKGQPAPTRR